MAEPSTHPAPETGAKPAERPSGGRPSEEEAVAPPPPPPPPLYSRGGIVGMVLVMILEIPLILIVANWMRRTDLEAVPTVASALEAAVDLGTFKETVQTLRGTKNFSARIKVRVNPQLKDPAIGRSVLQMERLKVKQEIQAALREAGEEAVEQPPASNTRLAARILDKINGSIIVEGAGTGIVSEVYLVEQ